MDAASIKAQKWRLLVNRKDAPLCKSFIDNSYIFFHETTIPTTITASLRLDNGELYHLAGEQEAIETYFEKHTTERVRKFRDKMLLNVENLDHVSEEIEKVDFSNMLRDDLMKWFAEFSEAVSLATIFLTSTALVGNALRKKLIDLLPQTSDTQKQEWLNVLIHPSKENYYVMEEKSFYHLVNNYGNDQFSKLLDAHLQKFSWIGARGWWLKYVWKKEDIIERIKQAIGTKHNDIHRILQEREQESKKLANTLNLEGNELLELAREFAYLRTWRTDVIYRAGYRARNLFSRIAEVSGFSKEDMVYLIKDEIIAMLTHHNIVSQDEIKKRKEFFTVLIWDYKPTIYSGKEMAKEFESLFDLNISSYEVQGQSAFSGKVQGRVKLVLTAEDVKDVKKGDILVAVMTFPHFIAAMEKAAAFVTDEGGILCHAAIISREMKKPCVISTKEGTKIFNDGDLVEVDADKGIVKKVVNESRVKNGSEVNGIKKRKIEIEKNDHFPAMNLPTEEECRQWFEQYKVPLNIREHCEMVRKVSVLLGEKLEAKGISVNVPLLDKAALLHDMFKIAVIKEVNSSKYHQRAFTSEELKMRDELRDKYPHKYENEIFYDIFHQEYPELAELILHGTNPTSLKKSWEEIILNYADSRVLKDDIVMLGERFLYLKEYYQAEEGFWDKRMKLDQEEEKKIFELLDFSPEELKEMVNDGN